jgi:hypothetical protein
MTLTSRPVLPNLRYCIDCSSGGAGICFRPTFRVPAPRVTGLRNRLRTVAFYADPGTVLAWFMKESGAWLAIPAHIGM